VTRSDPAAHSLSILGEDRPLPLGKEDLAAEDPVVRRTAIFLQASLVELGLGEPPLTNLDESSHTNQEAPSLASPERDGAPSSGLLAEDHGLAVALLLLAHTLRLPLRPGLLVLGTLSSSGLVLPPREATLLRCGRLLDGGLIPPPTVLLSGRRPSIEEPSSAERLQRHRGTHEVRILGVRTFPEAANDALGLEARLRDGELELPPERLGLVVERLWRLTLEGAPPQLGWRVVAALASGLLLRHTADLLLRWKAAFARDVARRHLGEAALLLWPEEDILGAFSRETRLLIVAHVVQSVADGDPLLALETAERASRLISVISPLPADATLLGAIGRAEAAACAFERAAASLDTALQIWESLRLRTESSYALCERLRVLGILGQEEAVLDLIETSVRTFLQEEQTSKVARSFVLLAAGRALAQLGRHAEAIERLEPEDAWSQAPDHVQASRLRWLSFAQRATGLSGQAASTLRALGCLGDTDQLHLAHLDDALARGTTTGEMVPLVQGLLNAEEGGDEARRLLLVLAPGRGVPLCIQDRSIIQRLCREYRY
jgi:tetratricopeptide (TPR) repeat protein